MAMELGSEVILGRRGNTQLIQPHCSGLRTPAVMGCNKGCFLFAAAKS